MALIRIDWRPSEKKIRQFGVLLAVFALIPAAAAWHKSEYHKAVMITAMGGMAGSLAAAFPAFGGLLYRAWMSVAFVIGTIVSTAALVVLYYGVLAPVGLLFRLAGRDALGLKRGGRATYWVPLSIPKEKTYFERLS